MSKEKDNTVKFSCNISKQVYSAPTGFAIHGATVDIKDENKVKLNKYGNISLVSNGIDLSEGVDYDIEAKVKYDKRFGVQYEVISSKRLKPRGLEESKQFLEEVISPAKAHELLKHYPNIVDKVVNNDLDDIDLSKTHGIKEATFEKIKKKIISNFGLMDMMETYGKYGISMNVLKKLYDEYGSVKKVEIALKQRPYQALYGIRGIGFIKADDIVLSLPSELLGAEGDIKESRDRMLACMMYLLDDNESNGHTRIDANDFRERCYELTPQCISHFADILKNENNKIYFDKDTVSVAKTNTFNKEKNIANIIKRLLYNHKDLHLPYEHYRLDKHSGIELTDQQLQTLEYLSKYSISMLIGAGGSGKSASMKSAITMLDDSKLRYILLAPTGKSAQVLERISQRDAKTVHRGLEYGVNEDTGKWEFAYNKYNKLPYDFVIVDEATMIDVHLFSALLDAIDENKTRILFIQDTAQIPSVSAGNCSHDLLESGLIPTTTLDKIFRYGEGGLYNVATKIRKGENFLPKSSDNIKGVIKFGEKNDYSFIDTVTNSVEDVNKLYMNLINKGYTIGDITVMSHHNKGAYGTKALNKRIQESVNPITDDKKHIKYGDTTFAIDDKVMQLSNNYKAKPYPYEEGLKTSIYNGNTGIIVDIFGDELVVDFGNDKLIMYKGDDLQSLDLAYAVSIHKMQGSSSRITIILTPNSHIYFMNRNLLYTAVSRTEEICYHFVTEKLLNIALRKSASMDRDTLLGELLKRETNEGECDIFE